MYKQGLIRDEKEVNEQREEDEDDEFMEFIDERLGLSKEVSNSN